MWPVRVYVPVGMSSWAVKSEYIEYNDSRRICRQCGQYTECSASGQPRVQTVQGDHIAGPGIVWCKVVKLTKFR